MSHAAGILPNGEYRISSAHHASHFLRASDRNVVLTRGHLVYWNLTYNSADGTYRVTHVNTDLVLDLDLRSLAVVIFPRRNSDNQRWNIRRLDSGAFDVRNVANAQARLAASHADSSHHNVEVLGVTASGEDKLREWIFTPKASA